MSQAIFIIVSMINTYFMCSYNFDYTYQVFLYEKEETLIDKRLTYFLEQ